MYVVFCFVAYGKITGFISAIDYNDIIAQNGFDSNVLPISMEFVIVGVSFMGMVFNLITAWWLYTNRGFWSWVICSVIGFCVICAIAGPIFGVSPILSLFGACCGFMLLMGWVFGLTYIQFCVIGNIWVPVVSVIVAAGVMLYAVLSNKKVSLAGKAAIILWGGVQILLSLIFCVHYALPMKDAFYLCVHDLMQLAKVCHTTYEIVNLVIYVLGVVFVLASDIIVTRKYIITSANKKYGLR